MRHGRWHRRCNHVNLPAQNRSDRRCAAAKRHVHRIHTLERLEQELGREMGRRAHAGGRVIELAALQFDVLLQIVGRDRGTHRQYGRRRSDHRHRHQFGQRIEALLAYARADGHGCGMHQQRVAIGRRRGNRPGRQCAGGAVAILDHHRLAHALGEFLPDQAPDAVGDTTGRKSDDGADRLARVGLGERPARNTKPGRNGQQHSRVSQRYWPGFIQH